MREYTIQQMIAMRATRPIVRPTAPPELRPPPLFLDTPVRLCEFTGVVGVTVTVLTLSVTVARDVIGVGICVIDDEEDDFEVEVMATATTDVVFGVSEACSRGTSTWDSIENL
jgi:hypothetical protein